MKHKKIHKITLQTMLLSVLAISLLMVASGLFATYAAENVFDSDVPVWDVSSTDATTLGEPKIIMVTAEPAGTNVSFAVTGEQIYADWGSGKPVFVGDVGEGSHTGLLEGRITGSTIRIYGVHITVLDCSGCGLTALDVSNNADLTVLRCDDNQLTALDVSQNTALIELHCHGNRLHSTDILGEASDVAAANTNTAFSPLTFAKSSLGLQVGETYGLAAELTPADADVIWQSSNTKVVTVDQNGKLNAVGAGKATVTAAADSATAVCNVTVTPTITLGQYKLTLAVNDSKHKSFTLKATKPTGVKKVTWYSSNPSVAKVSSSGKVTAVKKGTAKIYCKSATGNYVSAPCVVTVDSFDISYTNPFYY